MGVYTDDTYLPLNKERGDPEIMRGGKKLQGLLQRKGRILQTPGLRIFKLYRWSSTIAGKEKGVPCPGRKREKGRIRKLKRLPCNNDPGSVSVSGEGRKNI